MKRDRSLLHKRVYRCVTVVSTQHPALHSNDRRATVYITWVICTTMSIMSQEDRARRVGCRGGVEARAQVAALRIVQPDHSVLWCWCVIPNRSDPETTIHPCRVHACKASDAALTPLHSGLFDRKPAPSSAGEAGEVRGSPTAFCRVLAGAGGLEVLREEGVSLDGLGVVRSLRSVGGTGDAERGLAVPAVMSEADAHFGACADPS